MATSHMGLAEAAAAAVALTDCCTQQVPKERHQPT
eukprot:CAMPEP_0194702094 /NCGR_PEP_ID=MMETSP0295-20121207/26657_1 /TAXON_ID=39354 /ORGANISM="Heterosigma akashiwo, Strain CCMP2393" /LENGTH=34 /DNA_ID= /DNA_START= /DNA_END= /DNA_ORIENTATION=